MQFRGVIRPVAICAVMVVLVASALPVRARADEPALLTVRLYNASGIPNPELLAARQAAESIFRDTGLGVTFRQCGRPTPSQVTVDACGERLKPSEVVVRVIDAPANNPALEQEIYGMAYVIRDTNRGWLATVFSDRAGAAAVRAGVQPGLVLGLVMAHEIGHLLLGTGYHGDAGVMRAHWPDALLNRAPEQWRFSGLEARRLQQAALIHF